MATIEHRFGLPPVSPRDAAVLLLVIFAAVVIVVMRSYPAGLAGLCGHLAALARGVRLRTVRGELRPADPALDRPGL